MEVKTIVIGVVSFVAGYATKCAVDYFTAKKASAEETPDKEEEKTAE